MFEMYIEKELIYARQTEEINRLKKMGKVIDYRVLLGAIWQEDFDLIRYLVEVHNLNCDVKVSVPEEFLIPLYEALKCENQEIFMYLVEHGGRLHNEYYRGIRSYLEGAAKYGKFDIVKYLVERKRVNLKAWENRRALYVAYAENHKEMAKYLIEKGVDVNSTFETKYCTSNVLLRACDNCDYDMAEYLIVKGANVNFNGWNSLELKNVRPIATPLMAACKHGDLELAKLLVENGAEVNEFCRHMPYRKPTILHIAYESGNMDLVKYLVEKGAKIVPEKVFAKNLSLDHEMNGKTVFNKACEDENIEMMRYFRSHGAEVDNVYYAEEYNHVAKPEWYPYTSLNYASGEGYVDVANELLEMGANPNPKNEFLTKQKQGYWCNVRELIPIWTALICRQTDICKLFYLKGHPVAVPSYSYNFFPYWFNASDLSENDRKSIIDLADSTGEESFLGYMRQLATIDKQYKETNQQEQALQNEDE